MNMQSKENFLKHYLLLPLISLILLIILFQIPSLDEKISIFFSTHQNTFLHVCMNIITLFGSAYFLLLFTIIFALLLYKKKRTRASLAAFILLIGAVVIEYILKYAIQKQRPSLITQTASLDYSFPSGHALVSTVIYGYLAYLFWPKYKKTAIAVLIIPFFIGFSRIYLNLHWLTDVIAGFFFGSLWLILYLTKEKTEIQ